MNTRTVQTAALNASTVDQLRILIQQITLIPGMRELSNIRIPEDAAGKTLAATLTQILDAATAPAPDATDWEHGGDYVDVVADGKGFRRTWRTVRCDSCCNFCIETGGPRAQFPGTYLRVGSRTAMGTVANWPAEMDSIGEVDGNGRVICTECVANGRSFCR